MAQPFELIIFDFDGTLADSFPWFAGELNRVARRWGFRALADHEIEGMRYMSAMAVLRHLGVDGWKLPWIAGDLRARMAADIECVELFEGVPEVLEALAGAGLRLAVVSSNSRENVAHVLGARLFRRLEALECRVALGGKAMRLRRLLRRLRVEPAKALYIGDEVRDIEAARGAGIAAGAVTWGYNRPAALAAGRPELLFEKVADILGLLARPA